MRAGLQQQYRVPTVLARVSDGIEDLERRIHRVNKLRATRAPELWSLDVGRSKSVAEVREAFAEVLPRLSNFRGVGCFHASDVSESLEHAPTPLRIEAFRHTREMVGERSRRFGSCLIDNPQEEFFALGHL